MQTRAQGDQPALGQRGDLWLEVVPVRGLLAQPPPVPRQPELGSARCLDGGGLAFSPFQAAAEKGGLPLCWGPAWSYLKGGKGWVGWAEAGAPRRRPVLRVCALTFPLSLQRGVNTDSGSICREASFKGISK